MRREILRMDHIVCKENGTPALDHFTMQIFVGEIYGILSLEQNGIRAMIDLICHNNEIEYGQIFFKEKLINRAGKNDGANNKIGEIGTRSHLIENMSLTENLFVIRSGFRPQILAKKKLIYQTQKLLDDFQLKMQPLQKIAEMSTLERFTAGVLQSVVRGNKLIILNDISDLFSSEELPAFHRFIKQVSNRGYTFLYIYQHHEVLRQICDRIGVFKHGSIQKVYWDLQNMRAEVKIFAEPLYKNVFALNSKKNKEKYMAEPVLNWKNVRGEHISNLDLALYPGEIVLLMDRSNTVLKEIMEKVKAEKGCRTGVIDKNPVDSMAFPELSCMDNLCFMLGEKIPFFWQKRRLRRNVIKELKLDIGDVLDKPQLYDVEIKDLYTLIYYRYLLIKPDVLVCLQPLSGLDIYLRTHVLNILAKFSERGTAVLILATEMYDTFYISDRLIQMEHGKVVGDIGREEFEQVREEKAEIFPD
jgi:ribose transport system ATP-binding protein